MDRSYTPNPCDLVYAHPGLVRILAIVGIAICIATLACFVALPFPRMTAGIHWSLVFCCLVMVLVCLYAGATIVRRSRDTIVVAGDGLWWLSPNAASMFLAWTDVESVEPQNVMQRLIVTGCGGTLRIPLEFHLKRFGELRREVIQRSARPHRTDGMRCGSRDGTGQNTGEGV